MGTMGPLVVGVDGGQTSTRCVLTTLDGRLLGQGVGRGLTHLAAEGSREHYVSALGEAFGSAWREAALVPRAVESIALGLTGVEGGTVEAETVRALVGALIEARWVTVENDGVTALYGAHAGRPGAIVISGTGTLGLGLRQDGHLVRVGGWGWLVGDEGSAVAIGRGGLRAALAAFDGAGPPTALEASVRGHFGVDRMHDVKRQVYATAFGARGFAALATIVAAGALRGDTVAREIIRQAGRDLAQTTAALISRLDSGHEAVPLALVGGAFEHLEGLAAAFETALAAAQVRTRLVSPDLPPVLGAVLLALRACEASLTTALPQLRASTGILRFA